MFKTSKVLRSIEYTFLPRTRSPKTTAKLVQNNVYCFTSLLQVYRCYWTYVGITMLYRWRMSQKKLFERERRKWRTTQKLERKNTKDMDYNNSSRLFRPWGSRVMALSIKCDSWPYELSHVKNVWFIFPIQTTWCSPGNLPFVFH